MNKRHYSVIVAPGHRGFIQNMDTGALQADTSHILVPADSRIISMRIHRTALRHPVVSTPDVETVEIDCERIGELTKVQSDWREGLQDLAQSRVSNFNEDSTKSEAFCSETVSLGARERMVRKPVSCSAWRVRSVAVENRWRKLCRTTSGTRSREH